MVALAGADPLRFADALNATATEQDYELVVVASQPARATGRGRALRAVVPESAGLAARWNAGARAAAGELLVFVSAEAMPASRAGSTTSSRTYRSRADTGCAGSKVLAQDGTIGHAGLVLGPDRVPYRLYEGEPADAVYVNRPRIMPAVLAEGMVTARAQFVAIGGFDETLGEDLADADYCMRLRARGCPVLYAPVGRAPLATAPRAGHAHVVQALCTEFAARWAPTSFRSDVLVCLADDRDANSEWNRSWRLPRPSSPHREGLPAVAWSSHFLEQRWLHRGGARSRRGARRRRPGVVANPVVWDRLGIADAGAEGGAPRCAAGRATSPSDFVHVAHIGANRFKRHPEAMCNVGRTMFETDGLPRGLA